MVVLKGYDFWLIAGVLTFLNLSLGLTFFIMRNQLLYLTQLLYLIKKCKLYKDVVSLLLKKMHNSN